MKIDHILYDQGQVVPVLIWCRRCTRFISEETRHDCHMPAWQRRERNQARTNKVAFETERRAA